MKKTLCMILFLLLIIFSFVGCSKEQTQNPNTGTDYLSEIMKSSSEYPQLTKSEFIKITEDYLCSNEWVIPMEKVCFYTSGVNYSAYIIENEFLFSLYINNNPNGTVEYDVWLSHYLNGQVDKTEDDPLLFESFLN